MGGSITNKNSFNLIKENQNRVEIINFNPST